MTTIYSQFAWLIPLLPLVAFLIITALGRSARAGALLIGLVGHLMALMLAVLIFLEQLGPGQRDFRQQLTWLRIGDLPLTIGIEVTHLTALMLLVVAIVSVLVNLYALGYMRSDPRISVFFGYLALFSFAMLGLVLSDNLLTLYIFWELVGVCSFLLIGFWFTKPAARAAAYKAFIVTRVGDIGLLLAILLLYWHMPEHALDFNSIQNVFQSGQGTAVMESGTVTLIALLLFAGAAGKSGQFPLHVWLPDAMEGPTPISALIHAATMVAAGVFLLARTYDLLLASPEAMLVIACVGAFTALFAATIALVQRDIKRVLAYSTISQLGYMMMALGLGAMGAAMFHLVTHAFFKALLFLGAGSVIQAVRTQDIHQMGGLGPRMKLTAWTFGIGALALAGLPPLSGFWSKDAILAAALHEQPALFAVGLAAALLTALYMARLFFLVFGGKRSEPGPVFESPGVMTGPMVALAGLSLLAGLIELPWSGAGRLSLWLTGSEAAHHGTALVMIVTTAIGALGIYLGWLIYGKGVVNRTALSERVPWLVRWVERGYDVDAAYRVLLVIPLQAAGRGLQRGPEALIGETVRRFGSAALWAGRLGTRLQSGQVQAYGLLAALGLLLLLVAVMGRGWW
ncbi:NADH-quinone oxidoreductase subunit L [Paenibacillus sp. IB182496]|uniref:NADH-quinone oxidoreductase subunit L n=1 Tax=Paenibacillus sabuli TaxID=2772509 RepID=A0A927BUG7_9BACL|nr:NADH-quinone oxidoreductase subunit L [Paenibacillus sabuli]MBD2845875.1 NADH-quinone oxidoreductase subunit L [Paenibacillus sabuli]